ncbi:conserved unknown protein [Ectocarpus siliculosus]|uniref:Uncharacterized protein n=1 Tax=Ectocarpus siliculosus TaxID=2880 RepID=D7FR27_ECTSI|nr:conserved unknown protein [Ectocarpus siliculosus]|eukprot:CBJ26094.1 conserved unknown protein [Ectocarpus siliculosus]
MSALDVRNGRVDIEVPTDEDAKHCARVLKDQHSSLKSIDLRRGLVTSAGAGALAKALKGNSSLRHLGLPGNSIGDVGVGAIGRALEGNLGCVLASVDLSATGITVVGLSNLVQGVSRLPNLHTVCLNDNNLAQEAGLQLSNLLKASASLHTVLAGGNYLGDRGLAALCGAFCYLKPARVLSLDVSGNGIGDLGAQWLCKGISALCRNQQDAAGSGSGIRDLRLRGNNITHTGAKELATILSEGRCARDLRELDLSMNTITADGFRPLAVSLRGCRELVRLDVAGCRLGPGGVDAVADLIAASGPKLTAVVLTPKAEFADRVLGDRGGLAVALRQSLQRLADSLPFAGSVVEGIGKSGARGTGIERPKAGLERQKAAGGTAERQRRGAGGPRPSPPSGGGVGTTASSSGPGGLQRTSSKASMRGGGGTAGKPETGQPRQPVVAGQHHKTTTATLAARDRAAVDAHAAPHRRLHQGEELDSIEGFTEQRQAPKLMPPTRELLASQAAAAVLAAGGGGNTGFYGDGGSGGKKAAGPGPSAGLEASASGGVVESIADVVSKVMGDTAAVADGLVTPPPVAPSTWDWDTNSGGPAGSAATGKKEENDADDSPATTASGASTMVPSSVGPVSTAQQGGGGAKAVALSRKSSAASFSTAPESSSEPEVAAGMTSLALSDGSRSGLNSSSQGTTAIEVSSGGGGGSQQQLVTVEDASRMLAPLVAQEVEKETKKIEIRMQRRVPSSVVCAAAKRVRLALLKHLGAWQNEMNSALRTMRSEMEAIDREGLMARVAMEKRLKTGIKRLLERIDHLERRFSKLEREDRKRLALEAASVAAAPTPPPPALGGAADVVVRLQSPSSASETSAALNKSNRAPDTPEARPLVTWSGGDGDFSSAAGSTAASSCDGEYSEAGDDTEADIVRMLEEKMAALEGKLLGHEERQRTDPRAAEGLGMSPAMWA